jgi:sulfite exporter TauE/SafE
MATRIFNGCAGLHSQRQNYGWQIPARQAPGVECSRVPGPERCSRTFLCDSSRDASQFARISETMIAFLTGLIAGTAHVWSGPDHLAAVAPLAVRQQRRSWISGVRWGFGHSTGVALVGLLSLGLRDVLPLESLSSWSEWLVGVMLVGIGLWTLRAAFRRDIHTHEHEHDGERHLHIHVHRNRADHAHPASHARHLHAAFGIGTLHGLAGSSHLFGVLPALAFPSRAQALAYLAAYGMGTIISMGAFSWMLGTVSRRWGGNSLKFYRGLLGTTAVVALVIGAAWLFTGGI